MACRERVLRRRAIQCAGIIAGIFFLASPLQGQTAPTFAEAFEGDGWRSNWRVTEPSLDSRLSIVDDLPSPEGGRALRVTLEPGDHIRGGDNERVEIRSRRTLVAFDRETWYSFAVYVPSSFPKADKRTVIHQIKENVRSETEASCGSASPLFAIETRGEPTAVHIIVRRTFSPACAHNKTHLFEGRVDYDRWHVFAVDLRPSHDRDKGFVRVWLDGAPIVACRGGFGYPQYGKGVVDAQPRFGIYRDVLSEPATLFFSELAFWDQSPIGSALWPKTATELPDPAALPSCGEP